MARLLVAAIGAPIVLAVVWFDGVAIRLLCAGAAGMCAVELAALFQRAGLRPQTWLQVGLSTALVLTSGLLRQDSELVVLCAGLVAALGWSLTDSTASSSGWALTVAGALLVGGLLLLQVKLREL